MRTLSTFGFTLCGLLLLSACGSGIGDGNVSIFNDVTNIFPGLPDTNGNGIPEAGRGDNVQINLDLEDGLDCSPNTNPVQRAELDFSVSAGTLDDLSQTFTGDAALCSVDSFDNSWDVPNSAGIFALSVSVNVTRENDRDESDSILRQIEVF